MKTLHFFKAEPISDVPVEPVTMVFDGKLPAPEDLKGKESDILAFSEALFWHEAENIAEALYRVLPQGVRWKLIMELMKLEQCLFYGIANIPRDHKLLDWIQGVTQDGVGVFIQSVDGEILVGIVDVKERPVKISEGRTVRDALNQAATYESVSAEDVARAARNFMHEPENWEGFEQCKTSRSAAVPPEFLALGEAVRKRYGAMPIDKCESCGAVTIDAHKDDCPDKPEWGRGPEELASLQNSVKDRSAYSLLSEFAAHLEKQIDRYSGEERRRLQAALQTVREQMGNDDVAFMEALSEVEAEEKPVRVPFVVLEQVLSLVPLTEFDFREALTKTRSNIAFKAPEQPEAWQELCEVVNRFITKPAEQLSGWELQVVTTLIDRDPLARTHHSVEPENMSLLQREAEQSRADAHHDEIVLQSMTVPGSLAERVLKEADPHVESVGLDEYIRDYPEEYPPCPKCQTPNWNENTVCRSCGATLKSNA